MASGYNRGKQLKMFSLLGRRFKSTQRSGKVRLYQFLCRRGRITFTAYDVAEATGMSVSNISSILNREYLNRRLFRSAIVRVRLGYNPARIYTLNEADQQAAYESYLLEAFYMYPGLVEAYKVIRAGGVHSSINLRIKFGLLEEFDLLFSFMRLGLIKAIFHEIGYFFYAPTNIREEEAQALIDAEFKVASEARKEEILKGVNLQTRLNQFLENHRSAIIWRCVEHKAQARYKIGDKTRVFDFVLYFRPFIQIRGKDVPLKYFSKSLVVPIELKESRGNKRASGNVVDLHILESRQIWPGSCYPVLIGEPTDTTFKAMEEFPCGVIPLKILEELFAQFEIQPPT